MSSDQRLLAELTNFVDPIGRFDDNAAAAEADGGRHGDRNTAPEGPDETGAVLTAVVRPVHKEGYQGRPISRTVKIQLPDYKPQEAHHATVAVSLTVDGKEAELTTGSGYRAARSWRFEPTTELTSGSAVGKGKRGLSSDEPDQDGRESKRARRRMG